MNSLANELNSVLEGTVAGRLMSPLGKRLYFPKGIIAQSAEAKKSAHLANATIGMAYSKGKPLILSAIADSMPGLAPDQAVAYAPTAGVEQVRNDWKKLILQKNKSLNPEGISLPVVVPGLTSGLSLLADIFLAKEQTLIASDPCWDNYSLIFEERREAALCGTRFFINNGLNVDAITKAVEEEAKKGAVRIILNFPNNPSGYSPTKAEAEALAALFLKTAEKGADLLILCDDAYFGLFYEDEIFQESLFSLFANLHPNVLAVKIDGPIKEDYVWGLRTGFVTFGSKGLEEKHYAALVTKLMGAIRSSVSCANTPAQHIIIKALEDKRTPDEKNSFQDLMQKRYNRVKKFLAENPIHPKLKAFPFNSGYFMSFQCEGISAETLRQDLLAKHGIGVVALGDTCLRVAFSSLDEEKIDQVYRAIYDTAGY
jgi:aspartate/methionine/tyrosine aminotransferase